MVGDRNGFSVECTALFRMAYSSISTFITSLISITFHEYEKVHMHGVTRKLATPELALSHQRAPVMPVVTVFTAVLREYVRAHAHSLNTLPNVDM